MEANSAGAGVAGASSSAEKGETGRLVANTEASWEDSCHGCTAAAALQPDTELAVQLAEQFVEAEDGLRATECVPRAEEEEGVMCAICHGNIQALEVALVHGCDHPFCCNCILNWALQRQRCPLCQLDFSHLWMYKQLDGSFNDYLREESVALLHRAVWFRKAVVTEFSPHAHVDDEDEYHDFLQHEYGGGRDDEVQTLPRCPACPHKPSRPGRCEECVDAAGPRQPLSPSSTRGDRPSGESHLPTRTAALSGKPLGTAA
jgi:hypothetical protein